jgi:hypothetical protein
MEGLSKPRATVPALVAALCASRTAIYQRRGRDRECAWAMDAAWAAPISCERCGPDLRRCLRSEQPDRAAPPGGSDASRRPELVKRRRVT